MKVNSRGNQPAVNLNGTGGFDTIEIRAGFDYRGTLT